MRKEAAVCGGGRCADKTVPRIQWCSYASCRCCAALRSKVPLHQRPCAADDDSWRHSQLYRSTAASILPSSGTSHLTSSPETVEWLAVARKQLLRPGRVCTCSTSAMLRMQTSLHMLRILLRCRVAVCTHTYFSVRPEWRRRSDRLCVCDLVIEPSEPLCAAQCSRLRGQPLSP